MEEFKFYFSNKQTFKMLFIMLIFVIGNILIFRYADSLLYQVISAIGIAFFGIALIVGFQRLFSKKPALILNKEGIVPQQSMFPKGIGLIKWEDIIGGQQIQIYYEKLFIIKINNIDEIIKQSSGISKYLIKWSINWYGSPICISNSGLSYDFDEFMEIFQKYFNTYHPHQTLVKNKLE